MNKPPEKPDSRSRRLAVVANCLLNQNAKVSGLAGCPGIFRPLLDALCRSGAGLIQLPCPELLHLGPNRPLGSDTLEQYDLPAYRACCQDVAGRIAEELLAWHHAGYAIVCVLGVEGSPSCSVSRVPRLIGGKRPLRRGRGIFMEALRNAIRNQGLRIPFLGVPENAEAGALGESLARIRETLGATGEGGCSKGR